MLSHVPRCKKYKTKLSYFTGLKTKKSKAEPAPKKPEVEEPVEEIEYEEFSDDFFDDGVFGDEGYESLLDDYEEPKPKAKAKKSSKSNKSKSSKSPKSLKRQVDGEDQYYDYEDKGADSVFNLDE